MQKFAKIPGIEFVFFDAVDAKTEELIPFKEHFYCSRTANFLRGRSLEEGEIACFASHFLLWEKCIKLNEPIVVCEDDIELAAHEDLLVRRIREIRQGNHEYVRLLATKNRKTYAFAPDLKIAFDSLAGTQAYYITPTAARKFITHAKTWFMPVDDYMDLYFIHKVLNIVADSFPVRGTDFPSDVARKHGKKRRLSGMKITSELFRVYLFLRKIFWFAKNPALAKIAIS